MEDKSIAVKAAEMRRRRILGSEVNRMEKLTGNKQIQPITSPVINFDMGDIDFDALKKSLPMIKLKVKCAIQLTLLLFTSLLGATVRLYESDNKNFLFRIIELIVNMILSIPPFPLLDDLWKNNHRLRTKTVKVITWTMLITFILIKAPPPSLNSTNNSNGEQSEIAEFVQIPKGFKDLLCTVGEWASALLLFFFVGYDITHNLLV
ncbi:hypothetical protein BMR1_01G02855 [Babesia microti strain RI]|uniref:Uncharacterized protein n=1 Tax=Babesia microti (strain RI) TaxID=1133968 RepID=I7IPK2_BABMR|nr:hypothetical protein BMR1_01G02855 [Babesia microti strain RI]CCF73025.1 hypothetical protein BMR1_01G02855 [Babesia microti strain RI]|eukprot:XP_012647634.1 hypothetical protein BMR1_01G02855 [Babesia microti strain RI]